MNASKSLVMSYSNPPWRHTRSRSDGCGIKKSLNACSRFNESEDGNSEHYVNQYLIKSEIGRGSFGAVHLAIDQNGIEFAMKEFSKSRLKKRALSAIMRQVHPDREGLSNTTICPEPTISIRRNTVANLYDANNLNDPTHLISEEVAIMEKLNHPNLVKLVEILNDPEDDSLYMVLELCSKGVLMQVGIGEKVTPHSKEKCRRWFRDLVMAIEYLHERGILHRDIKPDNLLLTENDTLKVVDFGVSEMFDKGSEMMTSKSTGSPAFTPPELCVPKHGKVSGKAVDIWSMGISLYCLRFGRLPFEHAGIFDLFEAIRNDEPQLSSDPEESQFNDLMRKILNKSPQSRINMREIRTHPWVTQNGTNPLPQYEDESPGLDESTECSVPKVKWVEIPGLN